MTISKKEYKIIRGRNKEYKKLILYLYCDECEAEFICPESTKTRAKKQEHHFCSRDCFKKSTTNGVVRDKIKKTNLKRYGHESFTATKEFKEKFQKNCYKKYGVKSHLEVPKILAKIKNTCLEKYGRETFAGSEMHKSKLDYDDIVKKAWVTKLKNGQSKNISSKQEEGMYELLCTEYGSENIIRGKRLIRQFIDFYICPLGLYLQIDGVYWHGLNRPIEQIEKFSTRQDEKIYKQIFRDRKLNKYCKDNNIKLIRITDEEYDFMSPKEILSIIKEV